MNNIYTSSLWRKPNNNLGDRILNWLLSPDTDQGGAEAEIPDKYQHLSPADDIFTQPELDEEGNEIRVERTEERLD